MLAFAEQGMNGLMMGAIYALFALGMVLIYGVMHVLNFSHGVLFMAGAYACQVIFVQLTGNYFLAILGSMLVLALVGCLLEKGIFRHLRGSLSMQIVASMGLIMIVQNSIIYFFGPLALHMRVETVESKIRLGPLSFTAQHFVIIGVALIAVIGLDLFLRHTRLGTALRATSQNLEAARVVGVNPDSIFLMTFALATALAALAGALLGPLFLISPAMGDLPLLKGLTAIVLGGMGSVPGAIVGGFLIGVLEAQATLVLPTDYRDAVVFAALIGILLFRPYGLFGKRERGEP
ncbi:MULTISPECIES: branched-chain amino acid ABC transporter permease [unclassified Chelatococcus]|uniref:branched-chain amino acid ABC transporter permease n=1 Tax=unclassified Chelatococcus TaxID=2638111 RepID=UPI001BCDCDCE|nr:MULTISPECIES: branched-chain amino acid ABC transporter permease [unclassified Chelatococcus]MBS7700728.1 branched-chain amino acid ABC transporter permease [Chelatococcus sp. YT9]MBX3559312.1 branched-chain amino acid ABC transporter permease [Chelatococcus sp.]